MKPEYDIHQLLSLLSDPRQMQHIGLVYWINMAVRNVGYAPILSLLTAYISDIVFKTMETEESQLRAVEVITSGILAQLEELRSNQNTGSTGSTDTTELDDLLEKLQKKSDDEIN